MNVAPTKHFLKGGAVGPGMFFVVPCTDEIRVMDLRTVSFDVPPQEILTKDSVTVSVDAVVYYNIRLPWKQNVEKIKQWL